MKLNRHKAKSPTIMLTPMLDMFTMILIFLIASFAPDEAQIKKSPQITLPASLQKIQAAPHLQIEITKDYVKFNGQNIEGLVPEKGDPASWKLLKDQLEKAQGTAEKKDPVLLLADKATAFRFIDRAVGYLAADGFDSVYLVTETRKEARQ